MADSSRPIRPTDEIYERFGSATGERVSLLRSCSHLLVQSVGLYAQERRQEPNGSLRVLYAGRLASCRPCPQAPSEARENGANTIHPRRVSAVFWPRPSTPPEADTAVCEAPIADAVVSDAPPCDPPSPSRCVLWGDWQRCQIRRQWVQLLQTQTVLMTFGKAETIAQEKEHPPPISTRAQRAQWRLSWEERLARNARPSTAPTLAITLHGLPATFVQSFGLPVVKVA